jgi:hypothetical protein
MRGAYGRNWEMRNTSRIIWKNNMRDQACGRRGKGKVVPELSEHHAMKAYCGNGGIAPRILDLSTRWR